MKRIWVTALVLLTSLFTGFAQQDNNTSDDVYYQDQPADNQNPQVNPDYTDDQDAGAPTYQTFYDQLSPYGTWINYPGYGFCWVPSSVGPDFSPYLTGGHWVYTDLGWMWVSDYAWGWGPFHYGRWFEDPAYGWIWMPGYDWAPAWVIWGDYGGYYGWACIGPREILSPHYRPDPHHWHFIEHQYMGRQDFGTHIVRNETVINNSNEINNRINIISHANTYHQSVFFGGPKAEEVEKYSGNKVTHVQINNVKSAQPTKVENNQVNIYRPSIVRSNNQRGATPTKVVKPQEINSQPNRQAPQQQVQPQQHNNNIEQNRQQPAQNNWSPPRQSAQPQQQPQRQYQQPQQQPRQNYQPAPQPQHNFVPSYRPSYNPPVQQHTAPAPQFHGGGGRR